MESFHSALDAFQSLRVDIMQLSAVCLPALPQPLHVVDPLAVIWLAVCVGVFGA